MKAKVYIATVWYFALLTLVSTKLTAQLENESFYSKFDKIVGYSNSGLYYGKPNTPYPNINRQNHPFLQNIEYQKASLTYRNKPYYDVQIRYDITKDELQLLPDKIFSLLSITLFNQFIKDFSINGHQFLKLDDIESEEGFYEMILQNPQFKLLKKHHKKTKEKLSEKKVFISHYRLQTTLFISSNGRTEKLKSKRQLLSFFPEEEKMLQELFKKYNNEENSMMAVLSDWHSSILKKRKIDER